MRIALAMIALATVSASAADSLPRFDRLWDYANPAKTESLFTALLPRAEESGDTSYRVELLTQLARAQGLAGRFDEAHATLDTARALLSDTMAIPWIRYFMERGRVFNSAGDPDTAKTFFIQAWTHGALDAHLSPEAIPHMIDAAHMMATLGTPAEQLAWFTLALDLAEDSDNPAALRWLGPLYNNAGWTYFDLGEYDNALGMFEKGLTFRRGEGSLPETFIAQWTVGRALRALGRNEEALETQEEVLAGREANGLPPDGYNLEELGELNLLRGDSAAARPWFARAYDELSRDPWLVENEAARLERLRELGGK